MTTWIDLFTNRQLTALTTFSDLIREAHNRVVSDSGDREYADAVALYLAFGVDKMADTNSVICTWQIDPPRLRATFSRQAIPMTWDFAEAGIFSDAAGDYARCVKAVTEVLDRLRGSENEGSVRQADAARLSVASPVLISTDPPYYDNVGYADLSDYFYVWLRRSLSGIFGGLTGTVLTPKEDELVADPFRREDARRFFEDGFRSVFRHIREGTLTNYPITVFYAFKQAESDDHGDSSTGWETLLEGMIRSGWQVSGTWPIRTELGTRNRGRESNALASSIVLSCRPRGDDAGITDRRGFLVVMRGELPGRLRELQQGNIAPVDLAQAAIGPGMAVFSRHRQVTEPDGSAMRVRTALQLINQVLDEVLAEQEGDFDTDSRWCVKWFEQMEWSASDYGRAETLATALNTSVLGLERAGVLRARAGKVQLLKPSELPDSYDPTKDARPTMWEAVLHLSRRLEKDGPEAAGQLMGQLRAVMDLNSVKELAYLLYSICERKRRQDSALAFNNLVTSWPEIADAAENAPVAADYQAAMDFTEE
jgi:putative DNA methylase